MTEREYQVGIIGGGLAGLSLCILLKNAGIRVILFEKYQYPFHKICGEYLSAESLPFLEKTLNVDLQSFQPPTINTLLLTTQKKAKLKQKLPLGGIGISRYNLDHTLYKRAIELGVIIKEGQAVKSTELINGLQIIKTKNEDIKVGLLVKAFGKKSNLSNKLNVNEKQVAAYIGVKYHVKIDHPEDLISIHTFNNGYCGICKIENDLVSLCYLSHLDNLKNSDNSIEVMEEKILSKNNHLKDIFDSAQKQRVKPLTVSNIHFNKNKLFDNQVLYVGDAAGMITPLCGNGMSMALHSSFMVSAMIEKYFKNEITFSDLTNQYSEFWNKAFSKRMFLGRKLQNLMANQNVINFTFGFLNFFPEISGKIIKSTHGQDFTL